MSLPFLAGTELDLCKKKKWQKGKASRNDPLGVNNEPTERIPAKTSTIDFSLDCKGV